jgi:hypothetical protein
MINHLSPLEINRRQLFGRSATGIGGIALASLLNPELLAAPTAVRSIAPKAKRIISLFMSGGPSHVDMFDPKPLLAERDGQPMPKSIIKDHKFAMIRSADPKIKGTPWKFAKHGKSGLDISELLPHTARVADELCVVRSVHSETFNHGPAISFMTTGDVRYGRPTMGAWLSYGLGSENKNLPAFVVLQSGVQVQPLLTSYWGSGFLPSQHQGVPFRSQGDPVLFLSNPKGVSRDARREQLDLIAKMNRQLRDDFNDPEINTRIAAFELAYRMQTSVPELMDISQESKATHQLYGSQPGKRSFANNCLLARRLAEQGVRFVQLFDMGWDQHNTLKKNLARQCRGVDQATGALLADLKQRGLLDETLVIWGGEFGRTPMAQGGGSGYGRDHHPHGFSIWMAGGGIKPGMTYGGTDEFGYYAVENRASLYDINATILHCLGVDHRKLTYRFQGRDFRLTDVHGKVIRELLA